MERVQKLRAKANRTDNPHERAAYHAKADKIVADRNRNLGPQFVSHTRTAPPGAAREHPQETRVRERATQTAKTMTANAGEHPQETRVRERAATLAKNRAANAGQEHPADTAIREKAARVAKNMANRDRG